MTTNKFGWEGKMMKKFEKQKDIREWAVKIQREGRKGRYEELKRQIA